MQVLLRYASAIKICKYSRRIIDIQFATSIIVVVSDSVNLQVIESVTRESLTR